MNRSIPQGIKFNVAIVMSDHVTHSFNLVPFDLVSGSRAKLLRQISYQFANLEDTECRDIMVILIREEYIVILSKSCD